MIELKPLNFPENNIVLGGVNCKEFPAFKNEQEIISLWKANIWARLYFLFTGKIYLSVGSEKHPPVCLMIGKVFNKE